MSERPGRVDHRRALFGGRGIVSVQDLLGAEVAGPFTAVLACSLEADGSVGPHVQERYAEILVGLGGNGEATVDGEARTLRPGDVVYLPLGATLSISNRSSEEALDYLIVKARP